MSEASISILSPCLTPPFGFVCTRGFGHSGPCAAFEVYDLTLAQQFDALKNALIAMNREHSKVLGQILQHAETCKESAFPKDAELTRDLFADLGRLIATYSVPNLHRHVLELRLMLKEIVRTARDTSAAANCCIVHRQVLGRARFLVEEEDETRIARYIAQEKAMDDAEDEDSSHCECGAVHSLGTEESDSGMCFACGKPL